MKNTSKIDTLNKNFPMIGLSADWIFQTWLINGTIENGIVIFENEDNSNYEVIEFHHKDECRIEKVLLSGSINDTYRYVTNTSNA